MEVNTGIEGFDKDIISFQNAVEDKTIQTLSDILNNKTLSYKAFIDIFPEWALRLGFIFNEFGKLPQEINKDSAELFNNLKEQFNKLLPSFKENEHIIEVLNKSKSKEIEYIKSYSNVPSRISYDITLSGTSKCLKPKVRIAFIDIDENKVLYDTTLSINDILFIMQSFAEICSDIFKNYEDLYLDKKISYTSEQINTFNQKVITSKNEIEFIIEFLKKITPKE